MTSLAEMDHAAVDVAVGNNTLRVARLRLRHWAQLERLVAAARPDPLARIGKQLDRLATEQQKILLDRAYDDAQRIDRVSPADVERHVTGSMAGFLDLLRVVLRDHQPSLESDELISMFDQIEPEELGDVIEAVFAASGLTWGKVQGQARPT